MDWTETRIDELRTLISQGAKTAALMQHFGGVTRNTIIGQKNRLGLCSSTKDITARRAAAARVNAAEIAERRAAAAERRQARRRAYDTKQQQQKTYVPVLAIGDRDADLPTGHVDIHGLKNGMCSFVFDAPPGSALSFVYCGAATVDRSWCGEHRRIVYQPARGT